MWMEYHWNNMQMITIGPMLILNQDHQSGVGNRKSVCIQNAWMVLVILNIMLS